MRDVGFDAIAMGRQELGEDATKLADIFLFAPLDTTLVVAEYLVLLMYILAQQNEAGAIASLVFFHMVDTCRVSTWRSKEVALVSFVFPVEAQQDQIFTLTAGGRWTVNGLGDGRARPFSQASCCHTGTHTHPAETYCCAAGQLCVYTSYIYTSYIVPPNRQRYAQC